MSITVNGTTGLNFPDGTSQPTAGFVPFRNRIINGDMRIDQRNNGASVTPASGDYTLDRWNVLSTQASRFSVQRNAGGVTPPPGFTNYIGVTSLGATTIGSSDRFVLQQSIEGYNVSDLAFGTTNAKTISLSFWVRSSITGTHSGVIIGASGPRAYPFTFTVSSANTWEYKSVVIPGDTLSGTWGSTNDIGISIRFSLGCGSGQVAAANSWSTSNVSGATGSVNIVATNGATFYITGVQIESGTASTAFEFRPYVSELAMCQRYYQVLSHVPAVGVTTTTVRAFCVLPVEMRAAPTVGATGVLNYQGDGVQNSTQSSVSFGDNGSQRESLSITANNFSGITNGRTLILGVPPNNGNRLTLSAEI